MKSELLSFGSRASGKRVVIGIYIIIYIIITNNLKCRQNYKDDMFMLNDHENSDNLQEPEKIDNNIDSITNYSGTQWGTDMGLKPMNCPGHCLLYASSSVSYRDLPIRYAEFSSLHR
jgi:threonyl-tRNA synthetase